jgi:Uma2 family endonuclease
MKPYTPPHAGTIHRIFEKLVQTLPPDWIVRVKSGVTLPDREMVPDLAVVVAVPGGYMTRHPSTADFGLLIEVADSTLPGDRADKGRIYARAGIPVYWIVNVADRQIEVYTQPSGAAYAQRDDYRPGDDIPLSLAGQTVATLPVAELLP